MRPLIYLLIAITAGMLSCSNNDTGISYKTTVDITDYSLAENSCILKNVKADTLYIIKSTDVFNNYIVCSENDFPIIDFEKNILLLI